MVLFVRTSQGVVCRWRAALSLQARPVQSQHNKISGWRAIVALGGKMTHRGSEVSLQGRALCSGLGLQGTQVVRKLLLASIPRPWSRAALKTAHKHTLNRTWADL